MSRFFLFVGFLQCLFMAVAFAKPGNAQGLADSRVSANWKNIELVQAFADVQAQTEYYFTYNYELVQHISITNVQQNISLLDLLRYVTSETNLRFVVRDEIIYVQHSPAELRITTKGRLKLEVPSAEQLKKLEVSNAKIIFQADLVVEKVERIIRQ
ncbi:MAG: hypothetical protein AAFU03_06455 [Bacteroidota bacterium]